MKRKIVVATTNPGKIAELEAMLDSDVEWVGLADFSDIVEVEENGLTFAENACKKALEYARVTGCWTIADDSGLVVDALDGEPGVRSARFSGEITEKDDRGLIDHQNVEKVLDLLQSVPTEKRTARFVCSLALASPQKVLVETFGVFEGIINDGPVGENGFGYDPVFFIPGLGKTAAQLKPEEKNAISHRGTAIRKLKPILEQLLEKD